MALKDIWTPKKDGVDEVLAEHINDIADAVIENEKKISALETEVENEIIIDTEMSDISENPVQNKVVKFYIDDSIEISKQFKVVCEGELDEMTGGIMAIKAEITEDISKMKEFKFYFEMMCTEDTGKTMWVHAHINGQQTGNNCFFGVDSIRSGKAGIVYRAMCFSQVIEGANEKHILSFQMRLQEKAYNGTSTQTNGPTISSPWVIPQNETLYLNIVNITTPFGSGTKWRLEGR